jgi:hemoglobin
MPTDDEQTVYDRIGGEEAVRRLVDRFYNLMDELDEAEDVRALHADSLKSSRQKLFEFLSGFFGGPQLYQEKYGHPRLRARHLPFEIGEAERDQWMLCMRRAIDEEIDDDYVENYLEQTFERVAAHMQNSFEDE